MKTLIFILTMLFPAILHQQGGKPTQSTKSTPRIHVDATPDFLSQWELEENRLDAKCSQILVDIATIKYNYKPSQTSK